MISTLQWWDRPASKCVLVCQSYWSNLDLSHNPKLLLHTKHHGLLPWGKIAVLWMGSRTSDIFCSVKCCDSRMITATDSHWLCRKGEAKSTYGTGAFILLNTGEEPCPSTHGLLTTIAFKLGPNAPTNYALEGSIAIAGAAVQWLRDSLGIIRSASEIESLAKEVESSGGVYFVPAFNGLFAPWWRDDARGVCIGITRFTNKAHIARAVLESMCFQVKDVLDSMHKDAGEKGEVKNEKGEFLLRVDGGATVNNLLMQIQVWS